MKFPTKIQYILTFYPESGVKEAIKSKVVEIDNQEEYNDMAILMKHITNGKVEDVSMETEDGSTLFLSPYILNRSTIELYEVG